jgi:hypothetical protein
MKINRLLTANNITTCGKLYGENVIILSKHPKQVISAEDCVKNLRGIKFNKTKSKAFVRLNNAVITQEGKLQNLAKLNEITNLLSQKNISIVLVITASNYSLNKESIDFIKKVNIEFGVLPRKGVQTDEFMKMFKKETNKTITIIESPSDDWINSKPDFPNDIKSCVRGAWDQTILEIPCRGIDLYTLKNWTSLTFYNSNKLIESYKALSHLDYEVGIDIPVQALNEEIIKFINNVNN